MRTTFCSYSPSGLMRLQLVGRPEGDEQAAAARARNAHHHVAQFAGRRIGDAGAYHDLLQPQTFGRRRQPVHDVMQLVRAAE